MYTLYIFHIYEYMIYACMPKPSLNLVRIRFQGKQTWETIFFSPSCKRKKNTLGVTVRILNSLFSCKYHSPLFNKEESCRSRWKVKERYCIRVLCMSHFCIIIIVLIPNGDRKRKFDRKRTIL